MRVLWSGKPDLQISAGDLIKILSGFGTRESDPIRATRISNETTGALFKSEIHEILTTQRPQDFDPPIIGYAKHISILRSRIFFELEEKAPPIVSDIIRECARFIDPKLHERCKDKDYHDVVTNAFPILEDRIREKVGADPSFSGQRLIDHAFSPKTGRLILGKIPGEQQSVHLLFKGAIGFLRNPPSHSLTEEESNIEAFEIICMTDLLFRIVDKAKLRA